MAAPRDRSCKVIGRAHATVVGTFHYGARYNYVTPMDEKITLDIVIPRGAEIPEKLATEDTEEEQKEERAAPRAGDGGKAHRSGGGSGECSRGCRDYRVADADPEPARARGGDSGLRRRFRRGRGDRHPQIPPAAPLSRRGAGGGAGVRKHDSGSRELRGRRDYRTLPIVTIDGETARDFDDAVFVRRMHNGNFELQVHIADVAQYVREASSLDAEARLRGNSVYFPDRAVPMLPIELSTDLCSLRPHVDRLVMSCVMEIDSKGDIVGYEISPGVIRSAERMTYTDVNAILERRRQAARALSRAGGRVRADARAGHDPEPQARAPRLD